MVLNSEELLSRSALPAGWRQMWGQAAPPYRRRVRDFREATEHLAEGITLSDESADFAALVHPTENAQAPIHRWFTYKEAFSHRLPRAIIGRLGSGPTKVLVDNFAGVGTTPLALQMDPRLELVAGIEYSPFAQFVGRTKLEWHRTSARRARRLVDLGLRYKTLRSIQAPSLAAFRNAEIFDPGTLRRLISARDHIRSLDVPAHEKRFLLLGLAGVVEDLSGAMKDGRALRIVRSRSRKTLRLSPLQPSPRSGDPVRDALSNQWHAMLEDLEILGAARSRARTSAASHIRGDARDSNALTGLGIRDGDVGMFLYSPPYLNCIDYSEVYKIELWLLGFIKSQDEFRRLRLGTLRNHPSIEFPPTNHLGEFGDAEVVQLIDSMAAFIERNHARAHIGRMVRNYFEDMFATLQQQYRYLATGGFTVCVIGNSTFSSRILASDGVYSERWRIPVLTDVILARLGELAGFHVSEIWNARGLRPRNVQEGAARESIVVLQK